MTEPANQPPDQDPLTREAIAWVTRLTSGEATTVDAEELKLWRAQSPEHEAAFKRAAKLWRDFGQVAAQHVAARRRFAVSPILARRAFIGGAATAAAASVAYAVVNPPLGLWPSLSELTADHRTGKGEQGRIALNPEIAIELSTLTSVTVRSTAEQPRIELISGEAAITSNIKAAHPLVVVAASGRITAHQASFNARCIDGLVSVTCLSGTVDVQQDAKRVLLRPGQQVAYSSTGLEPVKDVDAVETTSWRSGLLIFRDKPLASVIEEINRYRQGRIVVTNADLGRRVVNATFRRDQLDTVITQVQQLFGAKVTYLPAGVTLLS
ncbi:DUF4880 domain-containing protein [Hyphomicrobium sp. CS1BSMeth3]|uniref:FecR family protein n=1 Tax=Hyphomicrobium sp. CS1BSMeth3 TaxID=1892844 RepID=UPI000931ADCA|nr:DUF4880 domain-containing protein [Hyphomicrobium sp. CS1BSMeth3]